MVDPREPLDTLIAPPSRFTAGTTFPRAKEIRLYDTTLRDGEQTPGVAFAPEQKYELAGMLSDAGVHIIDMGFPSAAPSERRALELILEGKQKGRIRPDLEIIVMCRSNAGDIDVTVDTLKRMGARPSDCTFFIFTSGSDLHLKYKIGKTLLQLEGRRPEEWVELPVSFYREANIRMACEAIRHARSRGVEAIEFGGEDGSRADVGYLIELAEACYRAGGTRYSFPDTVGFFAPRGGGLLHPEAGGGLSQQAPGRPLPQRLRPRGLQHRARAAPRRDHPHLHRERDRRAGGQRAPAHHGDDPEGALRGRDPGLPLRHAVGAAPQGRLGGGALIALGLFAGYAAFVASGQMAAAYFMAHAPQGFWPLQNKGELAVVYCFVFLYIATQGSGHWSVDRMIGNKR